MIYAIMMWCGPRWFLSLLQILHCLQLTHFPLDVLIPVQPISLPDPHGSLSIVPNHLMLVQGRLLNNREAILIKHMIVGDGDKGSGGLQRAGNVWVTEEVRFDLKYAVAVLMTNNFHDVTKIHGLLPIKHVDCNRCVVEAQEGSNHQPGLSWRILTLPSRSWLVLPQLKLMFYKKNGINVGRKFMSSTV